MAWTRGKIITIPKKSLFLKNRGFVIVIFSKTINAIEDYLALGGNCGRNERKENPEMFHFFWTL